MDNPTNPRVDYLTFDKLFRGAVVMTTDGRAAWLNSLGEPSFLSWKAEREAYGVTFGDGPLFDAIEAARFAYDYELRERAHDQDSRAIKSMTEDESVVYFREKLERQAACVRVARYDEPGPTDQKPGYTERDINGRVWNLSQCAVCGAWNWHGQDLGGPLDYCQACDDAEDNR